MRNGSTALPEMSRAAWNARRMFRSILFLVAIAAGLLLAGCGASSEAWNPSSEVEARIAPEATPDAEGFVSASMITPIAPAATAQPAVQSTSDSNSRRPVQFSGQVTDIPGDGWRGEWQVAGRAVHVGPSTVINQSLGTVGAGANVTVEGWLRPDGSVEAGWVRVVNLVRPTLIPPLPDATLAPPTGNANPTPTTGVRPPATTAPSIPFPAGSEVEMCGAINRLPSGGFAGDWHIGDRTIHVNEGTRREAQEGRYDIGWPALVRGWLQEDGSINAGAIDVKKPDNNDRCEPGIWLADSNSDDPDRDNDDARDDDDKDKDKDKDKADKGKADKNKDKGKDDKGKGNNGNGNKGNGNNGNGNSGSKWEGSVERLPANGLVGTWVIGGREVQVNADTKIKLNSDAGRLGLGGEVKVEGWYDESGRFHAKKIESKG